MTVKPAHCLTWKIRAVHGERSLRTPRHRIRLAVPLGQFKPSEAEARRQPAENSHNRLSKKRLGAKDSDTIGNLRRLVLDGVLPAEPLNAACRVNQLLFAGEKRMARRTNFDVKVLGRGTGLDHIPAGTGDLCRLIFRVNLTLHISFSYKLN